MIDPVDDLLTDLDRALDIEPSSSLNAMVRTAWQHSPESGLGFPWRTTAGSILAVLIAGVLIWQSIPAPGASRTAPVVASRRVADEPSERPPSASATPSRRPPSDRAGLRRTEMRPVTYTRFESDEPVVVGSRLQMVHADPIRTTLLDTSLIEVDEVRDDPLIRILPLTIDPLDVGTETLRGKS